MRNMLVLGVCGALLAGCGGTKMPTAPSKVGTAQAASATGGASNGDGSGLTGGSGGSSGHDDNGAAVTEVTGTIDALPPETPPAAFRVAGRLVQTSGSTVIREGSLVRSFADLKMGERIDAHGTLAGDTLDATEIEIDQDTAAPPAGTPPGMSPTPPKDPAPPQAEVELSGTVAGLAGPASAFQFNLGGRVVRGDATTAFTGSDNAVVSFADLKNGASVEVHGQQGNGFVQATRVQIEKPETEPGEDPPGEDNEAQVEGTLGTIAGACPAISSSVGLTMFSTSSSTRFDGAACSSFKAGDRVEVDGVRQTNGSIAATRLRKK